MRRPRVVAMGAAAESLNGAISVELVRADSGYDAAVELLAAPTEVLVADLGRLAGAHLGLLRLARDMGVPVVGFGTIPAGIPAQELADVRLVDLKGMDATVRKIAGLTGPERPAELPPEAPAEDETIEDRPTELQPVEAPQAAAKPTPEKAPKPAAEEAPKPTARKPAAKPAPKSGADKGAAPKPPAKPAKLSETLTPEELEALLGEDV